MPLFIEILNKMPEMNTYKFNIKISGFEVLTLYSRLMSIKFIEFIGRYTFKITFTLYDNTNSFCNLTIVLLVSIKHIRFVSLNVCYPGISQFVL